MKNDHYVNYDNQFHRPRKNKPDKGMRIMVAITAVLAVSVLTLGLISLLNNPDNDPVVTSNSAVSSNSNIAVTSGIVIATPTPTPIEERLSYQNPNLYPAVATMNVPIGQPESGLAPSERGITEKIFIGGEVQTSYTRDPAISFGDALDYQLVPGILTFRGNNFRNCSAWGTAVVTEAKLEQVWEYSQLGSLICSTEAAGSGDQYYWTGTLWTGQPLVVQWSWEVQQLMNIYPEKKAKQDLVEVVQAAADGYVYFFDLADGTKTRNPLHLGATVKGTPAIDPRGYPILYIGQGDPNGPDKSVGFRIFSLIDYSLLHFQDGRDSNGKRTWGSCDSSPIINKEADTLIFPSENGLIYTVHLNTYFDITTGGISVAPEVVTYQYTNEKSGYSYGIESSMAVYDHYGYCSDNSGNLMCLDLNTMEMVWSRQLDDDTDVTPVLSEENGRVFLYTGTEVDWQKSVDMTPSFVSYQGASYTYKLDAMTGEEIWQTSEPCYTVIRSGVGALNGGMLGTPIVGKKSISNLVIFPYSQTNGTYSGNRLIAYDKNTGEVAWKYEMSCYSWSSPVDFYDEDGNAYVIICDSIGQVILVNAANGERLDFVQTERFKGTSSATQSGLNMESSPIIFNNTIVIGSRAGSVFGVKIK